MAKSSPPVLGVVAPAPKPTARAIWLAVRLLGLPLIGALLMVDIAIWAVVLLIWHVCIGVWCWF